MPVAFLVAVLLIWAAPPASAQEGSDDNNVRPSVFFDCNGRGCNLNYFRTEVAWVNWARLRENADVHVIITSQATGVGGREFHLDFIGTGDDYEDQIRHQSPPTNTQRETLDGLAHTLAIGLLRFATVQGFARPADIVGREAEAVDPEERVVASEDVDDPWDFWAFRLSGNAELDGEETRRTKRVNGGLRASRVTPTWKMSFLGNVNFNRREIDLSEGDFVDQRTDWGLRSLIVYSLAERWSLGVQGETGRLTRFNQNFRIEVTPAVEYSFFPYEEATRRALTVYYKIGPAHRQYIDRTIYGETEETRWEQSLELELSQRQRWGEAGVEVEGSHFLHDKSLYVVRLGGYLAVRIARGLDLYIDGRTSWVNDQIYLPAEGVTDAEALLNLQQRSQDFNYGIEFGFSFQFGSIYNNVVNNRFGDGGFRF